MKKIITFIFLAMLAGCNRPPITHTGGAVTLIEGDAGYTRARASLIIVGGNDYVVVQTGDGAVAICPATPPAK